MTVAGFAWGVLYVSGAGVLKLLAIEVPIVFVCIVEGILALIATSPEPRTKARVGQLKNRLFKRNPRR